LGAARKEFQEETGHDIDGEFIYFGEIKQQSKKIVHVWAVEKDMKIGAIISSNDAETCWNALRYANFCIGKNDDVKVFFMGKGVEYQKISEKRFNTIEQTEKLIQNGRKIYVCGSRIQSGEQDSSEMCPLSAMNDMYEIVRDNDKVVAF